MKNFNDFNKGLNYTRTVFLLVALLLSITAFGTISTASAAVSEKPQLMFVQIAENLKVDEAAKTLRLVGVSQQTVYFSDRPVRIAGHIKMADYLKEWTAKAGKDNFADDPPNATLSGMNRDNPTIRLSWSRSPIPKSTVPIWSITTSSSTVNFPLKAV